MTWRVDVTRHAEARAHERLGVDAATVVSDVSAAIGAGRISPHAPGGLHPGRRRGLWAWSADQTRAYIIVTTSRSFIVTSALRAAATEPETERPSP